MADDEPQRPLASWETDGKGLGSIPPSDANQLEPATGPVDYSQAELDTAGVPAQALQSGPGGGGGGGGTGSTIPNVIIVFAGTAYYCNLSGAITGPV